MDAAKLLKQDHRAVEALFRQFDRRHDHEKESRP